MHVARGKMLRGEFHEESCGVETAVSKSHGSGSRGVPAFAERQSCPNGPCDLPAFFQAQQWPRWNSVFSVRLLGLLAANYPGTSFYIAPPACTKFWVLPNENLHHLVCFLLCQLVAQSAFPSKVVKPKAAGREGQCSISGSNDGILGTCRLEEL